MAARKSTAPEADTTPEDTTPEGTEVVATSEGESTVSTSAPDSTDENATTGDALVAAAQGEPTSTESTSTELPETTTLDSDTTAPSTTAPGDGPADTTDPRELASSAPFYPGPDALAAGTVNAVQKVGTIDDPAEGRDDSDDRIDEYDTVNPKGERVHVRHNLETGETSVTAAE